MAVSGEQPGPHGRRQGSPTSIAGACMCLIPQWTPNQHQHNIEGVAKKDHDSIVMMRDGKEGTLWAGRVMNFISHRPPGCPAGLENEANIADVQWFKNVPGNDPDHLLPSIQCPVCKRSTYNDKTGNMWPVERLGTCKAAAAPHPTNAPQYVMLGPSSLAVLQTFCNQCRGSIPNSEWIAPPSAALP